MDKTYEIFYSFSKELAEEYGVNAAIVLHYFQFWVATNKSNKINQHDGRTWVFNSVDAFKKLFPFWSNKQIRLTLNLLKSKEVLVTGNYNKLKYDRTKWYAFNNEKLFIQENVKCVSEPKSLLPKGQMEVTKRANGSYQKGKPIPIQRHCLKTSNTSSDETAFVSYWSARENLPEIISFTGQRKAKLKTRMGEKLFADNWRQIIDKVATSKFLTGQSEGKWKAGVDWILKDETNYVKVLEGKYSNNGDELMSFETTEEEAEALLAGITNE